MIFNIRLLLSFVIDFLFKNVESLPISHDQGEIYAFPFKYDVKGKS